MLDILTYSFGGGLVTLIAGLTIYAKRHGLN